METMTGRRWLHYVLTMIVPYDRHIRSLGVALVPYRDLLEVVGDEDSKDCCLILQVGH